MGVMITRSEASRARALGPWQSLVVPRDFTLQRTRGRAHTPARARTDCTSMQCQIPRDCQGLLGTSQNTVRALAHVRPTRRVIVAGLITQAVAKNARGARHAAAFATTPLDGPLVTSNSRTLKVSPMPTERFRGPLRYFPGLNLRDTAGNNRVDCLSWLQQKNTFQPGYTKENPHENHPDPHRSNSAL